MFQIEIFTENVKDMIIIKVKDSGLGMSKIAQKNFEILESIQEIFIM
jgi:sensor histidine kinase YesM